MRTGWTGCFLRLTSSDAALNTACAASHVSFEMSWPPETVFTSSAWPFCKAARSACLRSVQRATRRNPVLCVFQTGGHPDRSRHLSYFAFLSPRVLHPLEVSLPVWLQLP